MTSVKRRGWNLLFKRQSLHILSVFFLLVFFCLIIKQISYCTVFWVERNDLASFILKHYFHLPSQNLSSCLWWLFNQEPGRLYVELQFFCAVFNFGQVFISWEFWELFYFPGWAVWGGSCADLVVFFWIKRV